MIATYTSQNFYSFTRSNKKTLVTTLTCKGYLFRNFVALAIAVCLGSFPAKGQSGTPSPTTPITLDEAIRRAQAVETTYGAAVADAGVAQAERVIGRSTLLPGVVYHNQFLYT